MHGVCCLFWWRLEEEEEEEAFSSHLYLMWACCAFNIVLHCAVTGNFLLHPAVAFFFPVAEAVVPVCVVALVA